LYQVCTLVCANLLLNELEPTSRVAAGQGHFSIHFQELRHSNKKKKRIKKRLMIISHCWWMARVVCLITAQTNSFEMAFR
jgi:hypothetical protein